MNKQQLAFIALTFTAREVLGEEMGLWSLYKATGMTRHNLAKNILEDEDMDDIIAAEPDAANDYRTLVLNKYNIDPNGGDQVYFIQMMFTETLRDIYMHRTQNGMEFGRHYQQLLNIFYDYILTTTIFTATEGDDTDQAVNEMNAEMYNLEIRT